MHGLCKDPGYFNALEGSKTCIVYMCIDQLAVKYYNFLIQVPVSASDIEPSKEEKNNGVKHPPQKLPKPSFAQRMRQKCNRPITNQEGLQIYELPKRIVDLDDQHKISIVEVALVSHRQYPESDGKPRKVLMVVGATGAGKTTLINGMANYFYNVKWEDSFRFKLVQETVSSQAHSLTSGITAYRFFWEEGCKLPYHLTIIDTPGFGDTKGIERDKKITRQIKELFSRQGVNSILHIDGIGFVVQASHARLTQSQKYIFDSILSVFGKDIGKNFFVMCTFADGQRPPVLDAIKEASIPTFGQLDESFYKFNNSALFAKNLVAENNADTVDFDRMFWKMGISSFDNFFQSLGKMQTQSLCLTKEVLNERQQLESIIQGVRPQIRMGLGKIDELRQEERVMKQHEADIAANKDFKYKVTKESQRKITLDTGQFVTNCLVCNFTCHFPCYIPKSEDKNHCAAMDGEGDCKVCPNNCKWSSHYNNEYRFEIYQVEEERTSQDLMKRYHEAEKGKAEKSTMIQQLDRELRAIQREVQDLILRARCCIRRLQEIALKPDPLKEVDYIDLLIESEKREGKPGWQHRMQSLENIRGDAEFMAQLQNPDFKGFEYKKDDREKKSWFSIIGSLFQAKFIRLNIHD